MHQGTCNALNVPMRLPSKQDISSAGSHVHLPSRELDGGVDLLWQQLRGLLRLRERCCKLGCLLPDGLVEGQAGLAESLLESVGCRGRLLLHHLQHL